MVHIYEEICWKFSTTHKQFRREIGLSNDEWDDDDDQSSVLCWPIPPNKNINTDYECGRVVIILSRGTHLSTEIMQLKEPVRNENYKSIVAQFDPCQNNLPAPSSGIGVVVVEVGVDTVAPSDRPTALNWSLYYIYWQLDGRRERLGDG